ncbi:MAG: DUF5606 domain-containing protein [Flavobacteriales bacterium]|nr:DUF5606 domain-containing protein [Flavobacteriales bacterium]
MQLSDIISIAGKPGLHKIVGKRPAGLIVETLDSKGKRFPTSITQKISILEDISMYTYDGDKRLADVLRVMHEKVQAGLTLVGRSNSGDEIRDFFREVLPDFDEERVYTSDILKLISWYQILQEFTDLDELLTDESEGEESSINDEEE